VPFSKLCTKSPVSVSDGEFASPFQFQTVKNRGCSSGTTVASAKPQWKVKAQSAKVKGKN
jgi:hypothetical protein